MYSEQTKTGGKGTKAPSITLYDIFTDSGNFIRSFLTMKAARKMYGTIRTGTRFRGPYAKKNVD